MSPSNTEAAPDSTRQHRKETSNVQEEASGNPYKYMSREADPLTDVMLTY